MKSGIALIMLALVLIGCSEDQGSSEGRVVFGITDAAADMGTVTSLNVTIESISLRNAAGAWIEVDVEPQAFDLLALKAESATAVLADVNITNGNYTEMRLEISNVAVVDENGEQEAKLPSGELKFKGDVTVNGNSTSTAVFDFIADESLHVTGNGKYVLAPVIKVETQSDAEVQSDGERMTIVRGNVKTSATVGMDLDGNVGTDIRIPASAAIDIDGDTIRIGGRSDVQAGTGILGNDTNTTVGIGARGGIQIAE